jgi:hypothetical protein
MSFVTTFDEAGNGNAAVFFVNMANRHNVRGLVMFGCDLTGLFSTAKVLDESPTGSPFQSPSDLLRFHLDCVPLLKFE